MEGQSQSQSQRVVLAHDASRGVRVNSVRSVLNKFVLKAGDMFMFLCVVHQIQHPLGYMMRIESSMFGVNQKAIDDEVAKKKKEYDDNNDLVEVSKLYEGQKVDFKIELVAAPILKNAVVEASKKINATWLILDKKMKRDENYFLEKLSCGISTMKRDDYIVRIRGPKLSATVKNSVDNKSSTREAHNNDEDLFSIKLDSSSTSSTSTRNSLSDATLALVNNQDDKNHVVEALPIPEVQLDQIKCTTCNSTRPTSTWQSRNFSYLELVEATNRFSSENFIYRGENEVVFRGFLKDIKLNILIKVQSDTKKYTSEMQALEKAQNENVIMLLGTCLDESPRLLVFEYACNGSLEQHLTHRDTRPLTWAERIKIANGAAKGLYYLHENNIIHGDMRPKNILLTHDFEALIAGFGLATMTNESQNSSNHCIIGTLGYLAPEYRERGKATTKTDVYAFGIVLLQLVTGLSPTDTRLQGRSLIKWANSLVKEGKFTELIDPGIEYDINEVVIIVLLALKCVRKDPHIRLSMKKVMFTLDYIKDEKINNESQRADEIEEVNGNVEAISQSQRDDETEEVNGNVETISQSQLVEETKEVNGIVEIISQSQRADETEEVNGNVEIVSQSQRADETKEVNGNVETISQSQLVDETEEVNGIVEIISQSQLTDETETEEVNGNVEIMSQSQRDFDEKVIFSYGGMTPVPKQAKYFYQGAHI